MDSTGAIGTRIREAREYSGMPAKELADKISDKYKRISKQAISQYENGYVLPPPHRLIELAEFLQVPVNYFTKNWGSVDTHTPAQFRKIAAATKKHRDYAELRADWFVRFCHVLNQIEPLPSTDLPNWQIDFHTLERAQIEEYAMELRKLWGLGSAPIENLNEALEQHGIIIAEFTIDESLEAFSFWSSDAPYIFMSNNAKNYFRSRLNVAHELGHLVLHRHIEPELILNQDAHKRLEKQAFDFGAAFLTPKVSFGSEIMKFDLNYWLALKKRWGMSIAAMMMRAHALGKITDTQIEYYFRINGKLKVEPEDNYRPQERPTLLRKHLKNIVAEKRITLSAILDELGLSESMLQEVIDLR